MANVGGLVLVSLCTFFPSLGSFISFRGGRSDRHGSNFTISVDIFPISIKDLILVTPPLGYPSPLPVEFF